MGSEQFRSNRLKTRLNRASEVDGELRERLGCRRSTRISPLVLPVRSESEFVRAPLLSSVVEASNQDEELTAEGCIGVNLKLAPSSMPGVSGLHDSCCPVTVSELPGLMEMVGGVGSQGEAEMAMESGSGRLLTDDSPLSPNGMVSSSPSLVLDDRRILADAIVDVPVLVAGSLVVVEDSHVVEVVDRPVEMVDCHLEDTERPLELVDSHLVVADSPVEEIVGRPAVNMVKRPVEVVDVAAVVGQGVPVLGGVLGDCGGHEERRQQDHPWVGGRTSGGGNEPIGGFASGGPGRTFASTV
ncbi:hypothetical protein Dimus_031559, partial [Dionaea muscipula]